MREKHVLDERFTNLADIVSEGMGKWWVTAISLVFVLIWLAIGPFVHFSDSWQLWMNSPTTVAELFIGFLIAAAANRVERRHESLLEKIERQEEHILAILTYLETRPGPPAPPVMAGGPSRP